MIIYSSVSWNISWYSTSENFYSCSLFCTFLTCFQHLKVVPRDIIVINSVPNVFMIYFLSPVRISCLFLLVLYHYLSRFD